MVRAGILLFAAVLAGCQPDDRSNITAPRAEATNLIAGARDCSVTRVVDGDTVDLSCPGEGRFRARLMGFDTPETYRARCQAERRLGEAAGQRLGELAARARTSEARFFGYDRYDRRLARLWLDGTDVASTLVSEGLAVRYTGGRRIDWCTRLGVATEFGSRP